MRKDDMVDKLKRQCLYLVTEDRHRAACDATIGYGRIADIGPR